MQGKLSPRSVLVIFLLLPAWQDPPQEGRAGFFPLSQLAVFLIGNVILE